jgi:putative transposase
VGRSSRCAALNRGVKVITTTSDGKAERPADLVKRDFAATAPNRLWIVDFTYVPTWSGMCFTAFVTDVFSRRIVGWRVKASMPTELPLEALEMALWTRQRTGRDVVGVVHHSDTGSQYTAIKYVDRLTDAGAVASIGTVGDSYDNAMAESVNGLYKTECAKLEGPFRTVESLELATLDWVDWYNTSRLHSALGYLPPVEYGQEYYRQNTPRAAARGINTLHRTGGHSVLTVSCACSESFSSRFEVRSDGS